MRLRNARKKVVDKAERDSSPPGAYNSFFQCFNWAPPPGHLVGFSLLEFPQSALGVGQPFIVIMLQSYLLSKTYVYSREGLGLKPLCDFRLFSEAHQMM